jgi:hypothetical protein
MTWLYRITTPWGVFGFEHDETLRITTTAPIIKYMSGWSFGKAVAYCTKRNWQIERIEHGHCEAVN